MIKQHFCSKRSKRNETFPGTGSSDSIGTAYRLDSQDSTTSVEGMVSTSLEETSVGNLGPSF